MQWCAKPCADVSQSDAVQVDPTSSPPRQLLRIAGVGDKAHGLVAWRETFIILDSDAGALVMLHPSTGDIDELWQVRVR